MTLLESHHEKIQAAGLRMVAIAIGEPKHAQRYCPSYAPSLTCLCNQTLEAYRAYRVKRGSGDRLFTADFMLATARAALSGHVQGKATGDTVTLSATFIIDASGIIRYAHYDEHAGDHPSIERLLEVHWQ